MAITEIIVQHAEEAAFLWRMRQLALVAPHYSLDSLEEMDDRLDAHLDGLRVAGEPGQLVCRTCVNRKDTGAAFVGAVIAFEAADEVTIRKALKLATVSHCLEPGIAAALAWLPFAGVEDRIAHLMKSDSMIARRIGIAGATMHRVAFRPEITHVLVGQDDQLRTVALRAIGDLTCTELLPYALESLSDADLNCRFAAAYSAALLGDHSGIQALLRFVEPTYSDAERVARLAFARLPLSAAHDSRRDLARNSATIRIAVIATGSIGDPILADWLLERMEEVPLARIAGEAFTMITGADIFRSALKGDAPEESSVGPTDDPEDENVAMDPDQNLPWPNIEAVRQWWSAHQHEFQQGTRLFMGKPVTTDWLMHVLKVGRQRQRAAAAMELARLTREPLFNVHAPGWRQRQALSSARSPIQSPPRMFPPGANHG